MTAHSEPGADVLAELTALAAGQGWTRTHDVAARTDEPVDLVVLAGPDVDAITPRALVAACAPDATTYELAVDGLADHPEDVLRGRRILVALHCGGVLMLDTVGAVELLRAWWGEDARVVVVGAESLGSADELDLVERSLWRVLLGEAGEDWAGQDLAARGCLLWSATAPPSWLVARIERDADLLRGWCGRGPDESGRLGRLRLERALELADLERTDQRRASERGRTAGPGDPPPAALLDSAIDTHRAVLDTLDGQISLLHQELRASLRTLAAELPREIGSHLERRAATTPGARLDEIVSQFLRDRLQEWEATQSRTVLARFQTGEDRVRDLVDEVDWSELDRVAPHPIGGPWAAALSVAVHLEPWAWAETVGPGGDAPDRDDGVWAPLVRGGLVGGAALTGGMVLLGAAVLPTLAVGLLGATGGGLLERYRSDQSVRQEALTSAREAITHWMDRAVATVPERATEPLRTAREQVETQFTLLEEQLRGLVRSAPVAPGTAPSPDDALTALRARAALERRAPASAPHQTER